MAAKSVTKVMDMTLVENRITDNVMMKFNHEHKRGQAEHRGLRVPAHFGAEVGSRNGGVEGKERRVCCSVRTAAASSGRGGNEGFNPMGTVGCWARWKAADLGPTRLEL